MKRLLLALLFIPALLVAQEITREITIAPFVQSTSLDSVVFYGGQKFVRNGQHRTVVVVIDSFHTDQGSAVVKYRGKNPTPAAAVASIAALQNVGGTSGISGGAYLLSTAVGDTLWTLSDTCTNTGAAGLINSDTLSFWAPAARYKSVRAKMGIWNTNFPFGMLVDTVAADSNGFSVNLAIPSKNANSVTQFAYFNTNMAYEVGNAVGLPFIITDTLMAKREYKELKSIVVIDSSKQADSMDIVLFNQPFAPNVDSTTFAPADSDVFKVVGNVPIVASNWASFSRHSIATVNNINLALKRGPLYGQIVSRAGATKYTAGTALKLRFIFKLN